MLGIALGAWPRALAQERVYPMDAGLQPHTVDAAVARPEYLVPSVDPVFKTRVTRVTDEVATPRGDAGAGILNVIRHSYSRMRPWNKDGSLIMIGNLYLLDGKTYENVGTYSEYSSETFWSMVEPNYMWAYRPRLPGQEAALMKIKLAKDAQTNRWGPVQTWEVRTFPQNDPLFGNDVMFAGRWEGRPSDDDKYIALMARKGNDLWIYVVYTMTGARVGYKQFPGMWTGPVDAAPPLDWVSVSPSGYHVVAGWTHPTGRGVEVFDRGWEPVDVELAGPRTLSVQTEHGDLCWETDAQGNKTQEVWVQLVTGAPEFTYNADLVAFRLQQHTTPMLRLLPRPSGIDFPGHVSCTNYDRPGWAYVSAYPELPYNAQWSPAEVFAIKIQDNQPTDGGIPVQSFAQHHSHAYLPNAPSYNYLSEPHAAADPSGKRVMFASNWHATNPAVDDIYSYVAERPNPIQILPSASPPQVVISSATAEMRVYRQIWQAVTVKTPRGVTIPVTDLLFYSTSTGNPSVDDLPGAYWLDPDPSKAITVTYDTLSPAGYAETAVIRAERAGLTKTAYVTVYPDDPLMYVVVRLTTNRPLTSVYDNQLTYINNIAGESMYASPIVVDGVVRAQGQIALGTAYSAMYLPAKQATLGVIMAPPAQQQLKVNQPVYYQYFAGAGSNMAILGLNYQPLNPGEVIEYRYALYWNDGNRVAEVGQIQPSSLTNRFRTQ